MSLKSIDLHNFIVFEKQEMRFSNGINMIVGANGMGKTHLLKLLYAATQANDPKVSFPQKIINCFLPDDYRIARLIKRQQGVSNASVSVTARNRDDSQTVTMSASFSTKTNKWEAEVKGESDWEKQLSGAAGIFIPAKEILSNAYNLNAAVEKNNVTFDDTYLDIINSAKIDVSIGRNSKEKEKLLKSIEKIIGGKVIYDAKRDEFYLQQKSKNLEFPLVAEGVRKVALLWQLIKNGALESGSTLFWDEPEANLNPVYIPVIVELLLELQRNGVQIFVSTHDYFICKYMDVRKTDYDTVKFFSLYQNGNGVQCETADSFIGLKNNTIMETFIKLYEEEIEKVMD